MWQADMCYLGFRAMGQSGIWRKNEIECIFFLNLKVGIYYLSK